MAYEIRLDIFEGPLDLLLYLIKKNEIDIYNIPIALITYQYLQYMEIMRSLNLDLAGEYLVLASTLIHIKSRLLLPREEKDDFEEEPDPRAELVKQLLEYQSYKEAALCLDSRLLLERDVFKRSYGINETDVAGDDETELNLFDLVKAFQNLVSRMDKQELLEIKGERMSLSDRINEIMERLAQVQPLMFTDIIEEAADKRSVIYTLLAILELMKLRMVKAYQSGPFGVIKIFTAF
ncbi:MAG TPA: segregation/condensation protein A [Syntrophales bacterium]|nr:segregation/condensation protein A [Syntrophales bacterium]